MNRHLGAILLLLISANIARAQDLMPADHANAWWSATEAAWIGGGIGGAIGLIGAAFGILAGFGLARRLVIGLAVGMIASGLVTLLAGIGAVTTGQPYHVYYPLLLIGGITTFVFGLNLPFVFRRYQQQELQKMSAMDS